MTTATDNAERLEREAFEAFIRSRGKDHMLGRAAGHEDRYADVAMEGWWFVWQAARRAPAAGAPEYSYPTVIDRSHPNQGYVTYGFATEEECSQFIKATRRGSHRAAPAAPKETV